MKANFPCLALLSMALFFIGCKKSEEVKPGINGDTATLAAGSTLSAPTYAVETLYGSPYAAGNMDGMGKNARFNSPFGIQIMDDGTLYVADYNNNAIRKISSTGMVSKLSLKQAPGGQHLTKPVYIGVSFRNGDIHIIQDGNFLGEPYDESWIYKANGDFVAASYYFYSVRSVLARDPYTDIFYYSTADQIQQHILDQNGDIGGVLIPIDVSKLGLSFGGCGSCLRSYSFPAIAIGYNKVIYFSTGDKIFKYTPGGVTQRIFNKLAFSHITSIILNKDSRTMYVADNGYIKRVDSGKLTVIAGPLGTNDGRDGARFTADVYVNSLALGKGENVLYFTDPHANTVRKITLN
jgi:hypothetical protein